jgi:hypothetical protein
VILGLKWFGFFLLFWGVSWILFLLFNPKGYGKSFYDRGKEYSRVGPTNLGIWAISPTWQVFRILSIIIATVVGIIGLLFFLIL